MGLEGIEQAKESAAIDSVAIGTWLVSQDKMEEAKKKASERGEKEAVIFTWS